jgi:hypothetical protein
MTTGRANHVAARLPDGSVLVAGGWYRGEVWSSATGAWTPTGNMVNWYLTSSVGAPLADGRVLVTGGEHEECDPTGEMCDIIPSTTAEIFAP